MESRHSYNSLFIIEGAHSGCRVKLCQALTALCIAKLVDAGHVKYTSLVTDYWPEFGAHGKANVTVEMLVSHQAGMAVIDNPITIGALCIYRVGHIHGPFRLSSLLTVHF